MIPLRPRNAVALLLPWLLGGCAVLELDPLPEPIRPAPCVGEHSREVFAAELGMTDAEYEDLVAAGVTGTLDEMTVDRVTGRR